MVRHEERPKDLGARAEQGPKSEGRYRQIFENAGVALLEQDFSEVLGEVRRLRDEGVVDFRAHLDAHPEFVTWAARSVRIVGMNQAALQMAGGCIEKDLLVPIERLLSPGSLQAFGDCLVALADGARQYSSEKHIHSLKGEHLIVLCNSTFPDPDGDSGIVLVSLLDVTEREARREELLRDTEARLQNIVDSVVDAIITIDDSGHIESFNRAAERIFGYDTEEVIGKNVSMLMPEPDRGQHDQYIRRYLRTGEARIMGFGREVEGLRKDGTVFPLELGVSELVDGTRTFTGVVRDLTERKRLEHQFLQAQKMEAVGRLAGGVAHDFNNLLMGIIGCCRIAQKDLDPAHPATVQIGEIADAAERASGMTRQLLAFSRKRVPAPRVLDLGEVVQRAQGMLHRIIGEDVQLEIHVPEGDACVLADPGQIEQVLMNLVVNARDAMTDGGRLTIEIEKVERSLRDIGMRGSVQPGPHVALIVSDEGVGMDAEVMAHLFDPFFTTKAPGEGTGLGLSTLYAIVQNSGGHIDVDSAPGRGATFRVYFPRLEPERQEAVSSAPAPSGAVGETVLVVEDDRLVRAAVRHHLVELGYEVQAVASPEEALGFCAERGAPLDLLLTDIIMPGMSGPALARELAARWPDQRVLFMSAFPRDKLIADGRIDEGAASIEKPFTPEALAVEVRRVLEQNGSG